MARDEVNPAEYGNYAACGAANNGFADVVKLLLADPRVKVGEDTGYSICWTTRYCRTEGQRECVLVEANSIIVSDPSVIPGES